MKKTPYQIDILLNTSCCLNDVQQENLLSAFSSSRSKHRYKGLKYGLSVTKTDYGDTTDRKLFVAFSFVCSLKEIKEIVQILIDFGLESVHLFPECEEIAKIGWGSGDFIGSVSPQFICGRPSEDSHQTFLQDFWHCHLYRDNMGMLESLRAGIPEAEDEEPYDRYDDRERWEIQQIRPNSDLDMDQQSQEYWDQF
ncbi:hypothetical protein N9N66_03975 [Schleiferiaceae bacterium]|nr:hypothetical protein [Schleiferiaceae bacterium]